MPPPPPTFRFIQYPLLYKLFSSRPWVTFENGIALSSFTYSAGMMECCPMAFWEDCPLIIPCCWATNLTQTSRLAKVKSDIDFPRFEKFERFLFQINWEIIPEKFISDKNRKQNSPLFKKCCWNWGSNYPLLERCWFIKHLGFSLSHINFCFKNKD